MLHQGHEMRRRSASRHTVGYKEVRMGASAAHITIVREYRCEFF
jgi:hypothetical protein